MWISEMSKEIAKEMKLDPKMVTSILSLLQKKIRSKLILGEDVYIYRVGKLLNRVRKPRTFRNLQTGKNEKSSLRFIIRFEPSIGFDKKIKARTVYEEIK